jgi:hypothetical protein
MFLLHCSNCHHEWESVTENGTCDWCGGNSRMLVEHHWDLKNMFEIVKDFCKKYKKKKSLDSKNKKADKH